MTVTIETDICVCMYVCMVDAHMYAIMHFTYLVSESAAEVGVSGSMI